MPPALVLRRGEGHVQEWPPFWPLRFPNQRHLSFVSEAIAFAGVTRNARADHVFPGRRPTAITRHYVIQIQIVAVERHSTVLAGVLVPLENVVTGKFHF